MLKNEDVLIRRRNTVLPCYMVVTILELNTLLAFLKIKFPNGIKQMSCEEFYNEFEIVYRIKDGDRRTHTKFF